MIITKEQILSMYTSRGSDYTWDIYQPIPLEGYELTFEHAGRKCIDRGESIKKRIKDRFGDKKLKILDIGSNCGYFVFDLAKLGHEVVGVDTSEKFVDRCNFLSETSSLESKPVFHHKTITADNIDEFDLGQYDLVLCFSVIHHFKDKFKFLNEFSKRVNYAYLEIDGRDEGEKDLMTFYYKLKCIGEARDPYGRSTKLRKIFECDNTSAKRLKLVNVIWDRSVFKVGDSVFKRSTLRPTHTWLKTDIKHEADIYEKYNDSGFFPKLHQYNTCGDYHEIEMEYIDNIGTPSLEEIERLYDFFEKEDLIIIDFVRDMILFDKDNKIKVIDVESVAHPADKASMMKRKDKKVAYDTYEKQKAFLKRLYKL
jgi:SAM-dependent methyltransferase